MRPPAQQTLGIKLGEEWHSVSFYVILLLRLVFFTTQLERIEYGLHLERRFVYRQQCCLLPGLRSFLKKSEVLGSGTHGYPMICNLEPTVCVDRSRRSKLTPLHRVQYWYCTYGAKPAILTRSFAVFRQNCD